MNRSSRLLQLVVAGVLLGHAADAAATTYDDARVTVPGDFWGGTSTAVDPYENYYGGYTDLVLNDTDYSNGGSGGSWDSDSSTDRAVCDAIIAGAPDDCDLVSPPVFTANGCGGGIFTNVVPDYLIVNGTPVTRLGPIFSDSCNRHDLCYATYPGDKDQCDARLGHDMIERARRLMTAYQWSYYERHVRFQAALYNTALQTLPGSTVANYLYSNAQDLGKCIVYVENARETGCLD